mmetsp:Transcript_40464/g.92963  ORF Transcript_40464/g.92963 Transcript_40464/m.92963 type:complete len:219 (-) Transcript_40464:1274-1930(-)
MLYNTGEEKPPPPGGASSGAHRPSRSPAPHSSIAEFESEEAGATSIAEFESEEAGATAVTTIAAPSLGGCSNSSTSSLPGATLAVIFFEPRRDDADPPLRSDANPFPPPDDDFSKPPLPRTPFATTVRRRDVPLTVGTDVPKPVARFRVMEYSAASTSLSYSSCPLPQLKLTLVPRMHALIARRRMLSTIGCTWIGSPLAASMSSRQIVPSTTCHAQK